VVHINRASIGGEIGGDRHANPVNFPDVLDLRKCGLLLTPDTPFDWNLRPCSTEYELFGACFHRGKGPRHTTHCCTPTEVKAISLRDGATYV
jgi:hypothetical protein